MARKIAYDLISLGDTTTDVFLEIHDATVTCRLNKEECLLCIEYADKIPVESLKEILGVGNAANNAIGSARLGLRTALWTILGDDVAGHRTVREVLKPEHVQLPHVEFDKKHGTNYSTVINFQGERTILVYHQPRTYRLPRLEHSSWLYLTSMGQGWETIIAPLKQHLKRTGARLAFNPGTHQLRSNPRLLRGVLGMTHVLLVNRDESHRLIGTANGAPKNILRGLQKLGPKVIVVTDGPEGAYAATEDGMWFMPTIPAPVIERTGAGDSFSTGVLAALHYKKDLPDALRWGAANASSVIQYIGAREGLLARPATERLLRKHRRVVAKKL